MGSILNRDPKQMDGWRGDILWCWHCLMAPLIGLLVFWEDLTALADQRVEAIFYKNRQNSCKSTGRFMQNVNWSSRDAASNKKGPPMGDP